MKFVGKFLLAVIGVILVQQPVAAQARKVALLVGVNRYDKRGLADQPLSFAERDVDALAVELRKQGFAVDVLKGVSTGGRRATKQNFEAALTLLLANRNANDIVLLGFAGHGQQMPLRDANGAVVKGRRGRSLEDAFFCPVDAVRSKPETMISLTALSERLDHEGGVNLILVDACRDDPDPGRGVRSISGNELNGRLPANTAILFSCAAGQQALETRDAGGGHGVFFYHVLEGLRGEAANRRGAVTWNSLTGYVRENVNNQAKRWFPERAKRAKDGLLQTPHSLTNLIATPILAQVSLETASRRPRSKTPKQAASPLPDQRTFLMKGRDGIRRVYSISGRAVICEDGDGREMWKQVLESALTRISENDGKIVVESPNAAFFTLDAYTGELLSSKKATPPPQPQRPRKRRTHITVEKPGESPTVYFLVGGRVQCIMPGQPGWVVELGGKLIDISKTGDAIRVLSSDGVSYALDAATGKQLKTKE